MFIKQIIILEVDLHNKPTFRESLFFYVIWTPYFKLFYSCILQTNQGICLDVACTIKTVNLRTLSIVYYIRYIIRYISNTLWCGGKLRYPWHGYCFNYKFFCKDKIRICDYRPPISIIFFFFRIHQTKVRHKYVKCNKYRNVFMFEIGYFMANFECIEL